MSNQQATKRELDFIVIGAQKSGTTTLHEYLRRHPQICMPAGKEAPYFSHDAVHGRGWDAYLGKHFALANPESTWGTATPHYMFGAVYDRMNRPVPTPVQSNEHAVPLRIREQLPDVRLIAILRDPVERAYSHHLMTTLTGLETRPFDETIEELLAPAALEDARLNPHETNAYVVWGEYARILRGYLDVFPKTQILVLSMDELGHAVEGMLRRLYEFIGVAPDFVPDNLGARYRQGAERPRFHWLSLYGRGSPYAIQRSLARMKPARAIWRALPAPAHQRLDAAFDDAAYRIGLWNRRPNGEAAKAPPDPITMRRLREHFVEDGRTLSSTFHCGFPWHATTPDLVGA